MAVWRRRGRSPRWPWQRFWAGLCLLALAGCVSQRASRPLQGPAEVLVARRGWHIDIGFAAADLTGPLAFLREQFPRARYVFVGFGDERYIRSATHHMPTLLAALWPGRGVMLVTAIENPPQEAFGATRVRPLRVSVADRDAVESYIGQSFESSLGGAAPLKHGPYADSLYYASTQRYSGAHTCNTWAAEALHQGGLPVRSHGVLLAAQLWNQLRPLARAGAD